VKRRSVWVAGVAAVAGAAGLGGRWWHLHSDVSGTATDIWPMQFETPQGGQLELATLRGRPLLLNFWATWCPPCVSELPLLDRFHRQQRARGWQVVGLAVDNLLPVREFLDRQPVGFPIGLAGTNGIELARALGNSGGGLPFTVIFNRAGDAVQRKLGVIRSDELQNWADALT
jgi:thiol-disulfide isomerase/thioredoxin